ncbi:glycerophosphoryl diester phosphodiesterase [Histoplasma capsulatum]|uniref:Glycerophosphoryl diester phosphodiesterase n=1 Tax=Ajellomyces capsulatus TaxID=5037 RepID=A0A8A1M101_AJECA|nr:glycerophosphoryl diester phosphodiesterase [Histoplasma capsulatum]
MDTTESPLLETFITTPKHSLEADRPISPSSNSLEPIVFFPKARWPDPNRNAVARMNPITIAHRGAKAKFPENTMSAFIHAIDVGAQVIETDLHLSRDGEIVLSHDATLQRCFGVKKRIIDCDWQYLSTLRTTVEPVEFMPRLVDLLRYVSAAPERKDVWILLDIKRDNHPETIMDTLADLLRSTPSEHKPWNERIILGCWTTKYLSLAHRLFPAYPVSLISFSLAFARQFLKVPHIIFNMNMHALMGPGGAQFLADAREAGQQVFAWTVNRKEFMRLCIRRGLDGVVTDEVELCRRTCGGRKDGPCRLPENGGDDDRDDGLTVLQRAGVLVRAVLLYAVGSLFTVVYRVDLDHFIYGLYHDGNGKEYE